jgi:hypothetical protein
MAALRLLLSNFWPSGFCRNLGKSIALSVAVSLDLPELRTMVAAQAGAWVAGESAALV